jgi:hypothetical protein
MMARYTVLQLASKLGNKLDLATVFVFILYNIISFSLCFGLVYRIVFQKLFVFFGNGVFW